jgi:penicillin amidase
MRVKVVVMTTSSHAPGALPIPPVHDLAVVRARSVATVAPQREAVRVAGLDGEVVVHRDEWGIPHVQASSVHDAFFGQGFVQAEDRLGQLEYDRRRAQGRWAEVVGPSAVAFDVFARRCGLEDTARREAAALDAQAAAVLAAYADGVNAYLALQRPLPIDLERAGVVPSPWSPADCCAVFLVRHVVFANWQKKLWRGRLMAALGAAGVARIEQAEAREIPLIVPPPLSARSAPRGAEELEPTLRAMAEVAEVVSGSNSWALHGDRTASGLPLLAGDPHRLLEVPGVYYQCHLACPDFDAIGLAFVGIPGFPHFGHTARVAWCVTNANGDYQDLYVEAPDAIVSRAREAVEVRGAEAVTVEVSRTERGPVLVGDPARGAVLSMRSTALDEPSTGLSVLLPMLRARDVDELDDVMRGWVDPVNNFCSVDVDGNIAYRTVGRIPIRDAANSWGPVPGADPRFAWSGVVPYDELPRTRNPSSGLIITANQRIIEGDGPHRLGLDYARPDRAIRLHARLDDAREATVGDMAAVHRDTTSVAAAIWVERLLSVEPRDQWERAALEQLDTWDCNMLAESVGATVYIVTRDAACRILAHHPALASLRVPVPDEPAGTFQPLELRIWAVSTALLAADETTLLPELESWDDVLAAALTDAVSVLRTSLGDEVEAWHWGALHVASPRHPLGIADPARGQGLDPPPVSMPGEWDTVMCAAHPAGHGFGVTSTSVARYVFDASDWDRSMWIVPLGASGDATSPHFADQQAAWARGELVPMRYTWSALEAVATRSTRLTSA